MHYAFIPDNPTQFKLCLLLPGVNTWNGFCCRKYTWEGEGGGGGGSHVFCISGVCVWSQSVTNAPILHALPPKSRASSDPGGTAALPQYRHRDTAAGKGKRAKDVPPKQTSDIRRLSSLNVAPCTSVTQNLWLSHVLLVWGHLKGWCEENGGFQKYPVYLYRMFKASVIACLI